MNEEQMWDNFSRVYATYMEAFHYPMAQILYDSLNIIKDQKVLEVGTGGGYNLRQFLIQKPQSCHWYATDISEVMLGISQQRIEEFLNNPFDRILHNYILEELPKYKQKDIKELNLSYRKADSRDLSQFESNYFDIYYANQVLGHKENREEIFKEAWRVMKPNGLLGITSFGRQENCKYATMIKETALELGMDKEKFPNNFHFELSKKEIIIPELEKAGFKIKTTFYVCFPILEAEQLWEAQLKQKTPTRGMLEKAGADENMIDKILQTVQNQQFLFIFFKVLKKNQNILECTNNPITMEALYIIAEKQQ